MTFQKYPILLISNILKMIKVSIHACCAIMHIKGKCMYE
jgi:hypothetical protein